MNRVTSDWSIVRLGEVISHRKEFIQIADAQKYKRCRVQLHAKGIVLRDEVEGSTIKTKKQQVCRAGELLVAEIDAKVGGFGIVPPDLDGAIVSNHYFLYTLKSEKVGSAFIDYFVRTPLFRDQVQAQGSTNYAAIKANQVLNYQIPLPPLSEQRRIVARIERLAGKIEEAKGLRKTLNDRSNSLRNSVIEKLCFNSTYRLFKFGDVLDSATNGIYKPPEFWGSGLPCVRMYNIEGPEMNTTNIQHLEITGEELEKYGCVEGDLVFNRVNSAELVGKTGLITAKFPQCTFESKNMRLRVDKSKVLPAYAAVVLNSNPVRRYYREQLKQQCGMATLNQQHVRGIPFPLPSIDQQFVIIESFGRLQESVGHLKALQVKTAAELEALIPSILDRAFKGELCRYPPGKAQRACGATQAGLGKISF